MASYFQNLTASLPSFSSSSIHANTPPVRPESASQTTTSTLSSLGSTLSSRLTSLRRALTSGGEDDDPDSEDSSHISKVLRAYYTEKGRPFPPWLPPDPKAPPPAVMPQQQHQQQSQWGGFQQSAGAGRGGGSAGLGDLWEDNNAAVPSMGTNSLRRAGQPPVQSTPRPGFVGSQPSAASSLGGRGRAQSPGLGPDYGGGGGGVGVGVGASARPLPSQRAGSYQQGQTSFSQTTRRPAQTASAESYASMSSTTSTGSGTSARERLRAGLTGGRSSPAPQTAPPQQQSFKSDYSGPGSAYGDGGSRGNIYREERLGGASGGGGSGGREQKPFTGASSPWVSGEDEYSAGGGMSALGGGYGGSNSPGYGSDVGYNAGSVGSYGRKGPSAGGNVGLPSGPRPRGPR